MSPPIQFRSETAFSTTQKLHVSAPKKADIFLIKWRNKNTILALSLNVALWGRQENILQHLCVTSWLLEQAQLICGNTIRTATTSSYPTKHSTPLHHGSPLSRLTYEEISYLLMRKLDMSECDIRHKTLDHVTEACCSNGLLYFYFHLPSILQCQI